MSVYNPATPNSTDLISATQQPIKDNFFQLNDQFGKDHTPFNTGSANGNGFHKKVTLTPSSAQSAVAGQVIIHPVNASAPIDTTNFFGAQAFPFMSLLTSTAATVDLPAIPNLLIGTGSFANQYSFQIGNIIFNYGTVAVVANTAPVITMIRSFTSTSSFIVQTQSTQANAAGQNRIIPVTNTAVNKFALFNTGLSQAALTINFLAIGY